MKKYLIQILIILVGTLIILSGCSLATSDGINMESKKVILNPGNEIEISVKLAQPIKEFRAIEMEVNFDSDIIDSAEIKVADKLIDNVRTSYFNLVWQSYTMSLKEGIDLEEGEEIVKIKLKVKKELKEQEIPFESSVTLNYVTILDQNINEYYFDGEVAKYTFTITNEKIENISLSTTKYKIGEGKTEEQIKNYQKGDRFITQIEPNTTMQEFKSYLTTNGEMSIYSEDGTQITDNDAIIQTGMKLKVTKENCEDIDLELVLIGEEPLYLSTITYQIGKGDTTRYEQGDKEISKIPVNTTISEFIANLTTNGNISVYNAKGEDKTEEVDEFVVTGMKLKASKEGLEDIDLILIVENEEDPLYLLTSKYYIGNNNYTTYEEGDTQISKIPTNTTISDFIANLITNGNISVYNAKGEEVTELVEEFVVTGMKLKVEKEGSEDIELEIIVDEEAPLYLQTSIYKIGNANQTEYELGDTCISKIPSKTSITTFIAGLTTNGNISVYNAEGKEVTELEDELVGTGMKLKVSKEGSEDIDLVISVIGDTSGDGIAQADDLADTVKAVLGDIELKEEQLKAIDVSDDGKIEADDLADEVKLVLE